MSNQTAPGKNAASTGRRAGKNNAVASLSERRELTLKDLHPAGRETVLRLAKGDRSRIEVRSANEAIVH